MRSIHFLFSIFLWVCMTGVVAATLFVFWHNPRFADIANWSVTIFFAVLWGLGTAIIVLCEMDKNAS